MPRRAPANVAAELVRAARVLHDDIGPLLAAAGLRLDLIAMDSPESEGEVREIQRILGLAMENVRVLSRELDPKPIALRHAKPPAVPSRRRKS